MTRGDDTITIGWLPRWRGAAPEAKLHWVLRIAVAAEFIGHGAFGIKGKEGWLAYYDVFGIPASVGWDMMPVTGTVDITLGILALVYPMRSIFLWMAFWGLVTATLRPAAGEGGWELVERSYNYGIPLLLLLTIGFGTSVRQWFARVQEIPRLTRKRAAGLALYLRVVIGAYLVGHGALGLFTDKPLLIAGYESIGLDSLVADPQTLNTVIGSFEIALGVLVLALPVTGVLLFVLAWKLATEGLFFTMDAYGAGWEFLERGGAYAAPVALLLLRSMARRTDSIEDDAPAPEHSVRAAV